MTSYLLALAPLTVVIVCLILRKGAVVSAVAGSVVIFLVCFSNQGFAIDWRHFLTVDSLTVLILTLTVVTVIVPGQIMNCLLKDIGVIQSLGERVKSVNMPDSSKASMIVLGFSPALESLTGFGVSLFLTVPLLLTLFPLRIALLLSLLSMNIMPWGTLSLATIVGANLAGLPAEALAIKSSLTSFLVFPTIGILLAIILHESHIKKYNYYLPVLMGLLFSSSLYLYNLYFNFEVAGIFSGLTVVFVVSLLEFGQNKKRLSFSESLGHVKQACRLFFPYLLLLALMSISRVDAIYSELKKLFFLDSGVVKFSVLTSPGVIILLTVMFIFLFKPGSYKSSYLLTGISNSKKPVVSIMIFMVFAQLQRSSGIVDHLAALGEKLEAWQNIFLLPLIGMISGYTTGSNVGGNTLLMSVQSVIGKQAGEWLNFAAIQNSSAGHAVFLSIPIVVLTLSIAKSYDLTLSAVDQHWLIRRVLMFFLPVYAALTGAFFLVTYWQL